MGEIQYPDTSLIIFARAPVPGQCKTRLIPELGEEGAASLYQTLICNTVARLCENNRYPVQLWCYPDCEHVLFKELSHQFNLKLYQQHGKDLGQKMFNAFLQQKTEMSILVGTDIPAMDMDDIDSARALLSEGHDAVVGPAEDGGYTLIGLRQPNNHLFENIQWGRHDVYRQTCQKMLEAGLKWAEIRPLWDLDTPSDLLRYQGL